MNMNKSTSRLGAEGRRPEDYKNSVGPEVGNRTETGLISLLAAFFASLFGKLCGGIGIRIRGLFGEHALNFFDKVRKVRFKGFFVTWFASWTWHRLLLVSVFMAIICPLFNVSKSPYVYVDCPNGYAYRLKPEEMPEPRRGEVVNNTVAIDNVSNYIRCEDFDTYMDRPSDKFIFTYRVQPRGALFTSTQGVNNETHK